MAKKQKFSAEVSDDESCLVITIPFEEDPEESKSGKTIIQASTHGAMQTDVEIDGKPLFVSLNAYIYKKDKKKKSKRGDDD